MHKHDWRQITAYGHSSGDGSGRLMTVEEYCATCGRVATSYQSASTAEWHRNIRSEVVIRDEQGEIGEPGTVVGTRMLREEEVT